MKSFSLAYLISLTLASARGAEGAERPNVFLIIADDMAWDDCGAFGNPKVKTPSIGTLAREGMRFDRAFLTASLCSPSRSNLITGHYPQNTDGEAGSVPTGPVPCEPDSE